MFRKWEERERERDRKRERERERERYQMMAFYDINKPIDIFIIAFE